MTHSGFRTYRKYWRSRWCSLCSSLLVVSTCLSSSRNTNPLGWYERERIFTVASQLSQRFGYVTLVYLNEAYLNITKSFACNMDQLDPLAIQRFIFIAADLHTARHLHDFNPRVRVEILPYHVGHSVEFGTYDYFRLTLERLKLQNELLRRGINVFVVESDAVWFSTKVFDVINSFLLENDIVSGDDASTPTRSSNLISAGFVACKSNPATVEFFGNYVSSYDSLLYSHRADESIALMGEQALMTQLLNSSSHMLTIQWLDVCSFANGQWYSSESFRSTCGQPIVIQNNYVVGNDNKITRAKVWGHWFLDGESCLKKL